MKKISIFLLFMVFAGAVWASQTAALPELIKPECILVDNGKIYIIESTTIYIYSSADFKLFKKFGKEGEGPREFKHSPAPWVPSLFVFFKPGRLFINSMGKISIYSREGEFIDEIKNPGFMRVLIPFEENYIGFGRAQEGKVSYFTYNLHDSNFKKGKEIYRLKSPEQGGRDIDPIVMAGIKNIFFKYTHRGRFFLPAWDGIIHIFDKTGKKVGAITPGCRKVVLDLELKGRFDNYFRTDPRFKRIYSRDAGRGRIRFPGHLPLLKEYRVADGKVFVVSSFKENGKYESFIYDMDGKLLKKVGLPLKDKDMLEVYPFTIADGKIYQLVENEDEEEWMLEVTGVI